jgi:hypothetical protein
MATQTEDDLEAVLRTLKLAQAQLRNLKKHFAHDPAKQGEIENAEVGLEMLIDRLKALVS